MANNRDNLTLLDNTDATGSAVSWRGGRGWFFVHGTFASTSAALEFSMDGSTWFAVSSDTTKTANGMGLFELPPGYMRCSLTGGTPSAMFANAVGMGV